MAKQKSTKRVRAFRERQKANKPPKKPPKSGLERNREYRARKKALKACVEQHNLPTASNGLWIHSPAVPSTSRDAFTGKDDSQDSGVPSTRSNIQGQDMERRQSLKRKHTAAVYRTDDSTDDEESMSDAESNMETDDSTVGKCQETLDEAIEPTNAELLRLVRRIKGFEDLNEEDIERWNKADNYEPHAPLTDEEIIARVMERKKDKENEEKEEQRAKAAKEKEEKRVKAATAAKTRASLKGTTKDNGRESHWIKVENDLRDPLSDQTVIPKTGKGQVVQKVDNKDMHRIADSQDKDGGDVQQWIKKEAESNDPLSDQGIHSMAMRDQGQGDTLGWIKQENDAEDPLSDHQIISMAMEDVQDSDNDEQGNTCSSDDIFTPAEAKNAAIRLIQFFEKQTNLRADVLLALRTLQTEVALIKIQQAKQKRK